MTDGSRELRNQWQPRWLLPKIMRTRALVLKEVRQIIRDPSSIAVGLVLPVVLILLFGYGLTLDAKNIPIAVVLEDTSPDATELASVFELSPSFQAHRTTSNREAERLMMRRDVDGIIRISSDFSRRLHAGNAEVQTLVRGTDANYGRLVQSYARAAIGQWMVRRIAEGQPVAYGPVGVEARIWFNEANESRYFIVPGLIVLVVTLIGALMTALVIAREWERGTLEALFVTPMCTSEFLLSKVVPYFVLGIFGLALCLLAARFLFSVPFRGSLIILFTASTLYLFVALGVGLLISTVVKRQFVAAILVLAVTFLPAFMISGFIFDLRSLPIAVRVISYIFPARYYVSTLQTVLLAGDVWPIILPNMAIMAGMAVILFLLTSLATKKQLA